MNQDLDTKEVLRLQQTETGYDLYFNEKDYVTLEIKDGEVLNKLTKKQLDFVKVHI